MVADLNVSGGTSNDAELLRLDALANEMRAALDKTVLTLASGAFGLSVTFSEHVGGTNPQHREPLIAAWTFFTVAMVATLLSYRESERGLHLAAAERRIDHPAGARWRAAADRLEAARSRTIRMNDAALGAFILGAVALCAFAFVNM